MEKKKQREIVLEALGEASALFMSQECKGTQIVMPEEDLERIGNDVIKRLND